MARSSASNTLGVSGWAKKRASMQCRIWLKDDRGCAAASILWSVPGHKTRKFPAGAALFPGAPRTFLPGENLARAYSGKRQLMRDQIYSLKAIRWRCGSTTNTGTSFVAYQTEGEGMANMVCISPLKTVAENRRGDGGSAVQRRDSRTWPGPVFPDVRSDPAKGRNVGR